MPLSFPQRCAPLPYSSDDSYRVMDESMVVEQLVISTWRRDVLDGREAMARREASAAVERLVALGLPHLVIDGVRRFDCSELTNFAQVVCARGEDDTWLKMIADFRDRITETGAALDRARADVGVGRTPVAERFRVVFRRDFNFAGIEEPTVRRFLSIPTDGVEQRDVVVSVLGASPGTDVTPGKGVLKLVHRLDAGAEAWVEMAWSFENPCRVELGSSAPAAACPDPKALAPVDDGWIKLTPAIRQLALEVVDGATDPGAIVERCWDFLGRAIRIGPIHHDQLGAEEPLLVALRSGWADCFVATSLLVSLLRASGVPARLRRGMFLNSRPTQHYWLEAWLAPGAWVPFDTTSFTLAGNEPFDSPWNRYFYGALDFRAVIDRFPRSISAQLGTPLPRRWYSAQAFCRSGVDQSYLNPEEHTLLFRDRVVVEPLGDRG